jgi:hypothetical protein
MHAVERDERAIVAVLRLAGADTGKVGADGTTAVELARGWQRQIIQLMLGEHTAGPLLEQYGHHIEAATTPIRTMASLTTYAAAHGIELAPKAKPAC